MPVPETRHRTPCRRSVASHTRSAAGGVCLILQLGCSWQSDPATRLAYCVEEAVKELPRDGVPTQANCDLKMPGSYLVVLHPKGALRDEELRLTGLSPDLLAEVRLLRLTEQPGILVIATDPGMSGNGTDRSTLSSRTTYQMHFVQVDRLMVLAKTTQPLSGDVGGSPGRRVIDGIH